MVAVALVALVYLAPGEAMAAYSPQTCVGLRDLGEDDAECRARILREDFSSGANAKDFKGFSAGQTQYGVPVAEMGDAYVVETLELGRKILRYGELDPYSKERIDLIKQIKGDMNQWVGKYARGGSARKESARKVYIVIDALQGHLVQNGLAPLPKPKFQKLAVDLQEAFDLLSQSR